MAALTPVQISNIFNLMAQEANSGLEYYHWGWRSDINRNVDNNFDNNNETGRLFPSLLWEKPEFYQDTDIVQYEGYQDEIPVVLYFDNLQDYFNDGSQNTDNLIEQEDKLLTIAKIFMANFRKVFCNKYRAGHFTLPRFIPQAHMHHERLVTIQVNFTLTRLVPCVEAADQIDLDNLPASIVDYDIENWKDNP